MLWCATALAADQAPDERTADYRAEIIITGERVRRSVRDTASSVAVARQREIEAGSADRIDQILAMVPNVQLGSGSQGPAIRGLDTTGALVALPAFLGGNRPRTTLIVDGRRDTYSEFVFGAAPVWDIDRIEVFRSPQTTTQGQNSIAGAIFVYSNDPTSEPEYRARIIGGNYHTRQLSAVASGPLAPDVAMRVSGDLRYTRTTSRIADQVEGVGAGAGVVIGQPENLCLHKGLHSGADLGAHQKLETLDTEIRVRRAGVGASACHLWAELPETQHLCPP